MSIMLAQVQQRKFVYIIATSMLRLVLSTCPAAAQTDQSIAPSSPPEAVGAGPETVIVTPHPSLGRSIIGAPIQDIDMSQAVRTDDLNLHTGSGVYTLRQRVKATARDLCDVMEFRYPVGTPDRTTCYRNTVSDAQWQVDTAIRQYRTPAPGVSESP